MKFDTLTLIIFSISIIAVFSLIIILSILQNLRNRNKLSFRIQTVLGVERGEEVPETVPVLFDPKILYEGYNIYISFTVLLFIALLVTSFVTTNVIALSSVLFLYLIAVILTHVVRNMLQKRKRKAFIDQLPNTLELMARSIAGGHALIQAVNVAVENTTGLLHEELSLVADNVTLGEPLDKSIALSADRVNIMEYHYFSVVVQIQARTGGNIVQLFNEISESLRARAELAEKIKAITAEGRASVVVISMLPIAIFAIVSVLNPNYMKPLITTTIGNIIVIVAILMETMGFLVTTRLTKVDI